VGRAPAWDIAFLFLSRLGQDRQQFVFAAGGEAGRTWPVQALSRSQASRSASRASRGRWCKPAATAAAPDRVDQPSQPGSISHIASESGPIYSRTAWASSQLAGATTTGPLCPLTAPPRLSQTCISRCKTESPRRPQPCTRRRMTVRCFTITHLSLQGWWRPQLTTGGPTTTTAFPWSATARSVWPRLNAPSPSTGGSPTRPAPLRPHLHRPCARTGPCTGTRTPACAGPRGPSGRRHLEACSSARRPISTPDPDGPLRGSGE